MNKEMADFFSQLPAGYIYAVLGFFLFLTIASIIIEGIE